MRLIFFLIILTSISFAQSNPDGEYVSIHVSPFISSGSFSVNGEDSLDFNDDINFAVMLKIPFGNSFTLSPFWERATYSYEQRIANTTEMMEFSMAQTKLGLTLSFYIH